MDQVRAFDPEAWEELYRRVHPRLHAFCRRRLGDDHEADDAVSEVLARALAGIDRYEHAAAGLEGWLFGIGRNVVQERWRATARDARWEHVGHDLSAPTPTGPLDALVRAEEHEALHRAFARLAPEDRDVLELRVTAGLDAEAVGIAVGKSAGAVRMAQSRALARLRDLLGGEP